MSPRPARFTSSACSRPLCLQLGPRIRNLAPRFPQHEGNVALTIKTEAFKPPEPAPVISGRRASSLATLSVAELQDFADHIHSLTKHLAGCDPKVEVRLSIQSKGDSNLTEANKILEQIKAGWKL